MTKFRATLATFACATAIIVSAGTTPAAVFSELQGITTEIKVDELPPAPKLAAPRTVPSAPLTIRKEKDISTPLLQPALPSAPAAKLKSIKAK
jgi:hypothetical protein